jgi:hypothetical protein
MPRSRCAFFELMQVFSRVEVNRRVFPIVLRDANIYDAHGILEYVKYWETRKRNLEQQLREVGAENLRTIYDEIDLVAKVRSVFGEIVGRLRDLNALSVEEHQNTSFEQLISQVEIRLREKETDIAAVSLKTGESKIMVHGGYFGRYLPTGDSVGHPARRGRRISWLKITG